ncbi:MAG: hypothetical protein ACP5G7_07190, partial [Anaerolineae bacterium]
MSLVEITARRVGQARTWLESALAAAWRHRVDLLLLALIVASYGFLGARFAGATPAFEGAEEPWQLAYAMGITDAVHRFDAYETRVDIASAWHLNKRPPLYDAISRLLVSGLVPKGSWYVPNPFAAPWSEQPASLNAVLHGSPAYAPPEDVAHALTRLRCFSWAAGLATILLGYAIAHLMFQGARWRPLMVAAMLAWNPFFLATSTQANPYAFSTALVTLAFLVGLLVARGWRSPTAAVALGLVTALPALTSPLGLVTAILVPCAWLAPDAHATRRDDRWPIHLAISFATFVAGTGWWYLGWEIAPQVGLASKLGFSNMLGSYLSAWGSFGWLGLRAEPSYLAWMGLLSVGIVVLTLVAYGNALWQQRGRVLWRRWCLPACWGAASAAAALLVAATGTARAPFAWLPAFPPLVILGIAAVDAQLPKPWQRVAAIMTVIPLLVTAWIAPQAYITPSYYPPERFTLEDVPLDIRDVALSFDDSLYLLGYQAPLEADAKSGAFDITLYWLCTDQPDHDYVHSLSIIGPDGALLGRIETLPANGTYPTTLWQPAEVIVERYRLELDQPTNQPVSASLRMVVRRLSDGTAVSPVDSRGNELGSNAAIGHVRVPPVTPISYQPEHVMDMSFGDMVILEGYDVHPSQPTPSRFWEVALYWHVEHIVVDDWNVFVHLVDEDGNLIAQGDSQPLAGALPTPFWRPGDHLVDRHRLALPA